MIYAHSNKFDILNMKKRSDKANKRTYMMKYGTPRITKLDKVHNVDIENSINNTPTVNPTIEDENSTTLDQEEKVEPNFTHSSRLPGQRDFAENLNLLQPTIKKMRSLLMEADSVDLLEKINKCSGELQLILTVLSDKVRIIKNIISESKDRVKNIHSKDNTTNNTTNNMFNFVFKTKSGSLSWGDISEKEKQSCVVSKHETKTAVSDTRTITEIYDVKIPSITLNTVNYLNRIPPMFHWYNGSKAIGEGIYVNIAPNLYVMVPLPDTIDGTREFNRNNTVRCRNADKKDCDRYRAYVAKKYGSQIRSCNYSHIGDRLIKIGNSNRCRELTGFGNHSTLISDIARVSENDIKNILMYALSDILLAHMWAKANNFLKPVVYTNIDIFQ